MSALVHREPLDGTHLCDSKALWSGEAHVKLQGEVSARETMKDIVEFVQISISLIVHFF